MFSQFVIMLDVIEDFLADKGFGYERLDGSTTSVRARVLSLSGLA